MIDRWTKQVEPIRSFSTDLSAYRQVGQRYVGTVTVSVDRIVGSVSRSHELGSDFLPLRKSWGFSRSTARYRWVKKAMQQAGTFDLDDMHHLGGRYHSHGDYRAKRGVTLPPVELYSLGDHYYVVDGHHRVAAARALGQVEIDAIVTEYVPAQHRDAKGAAA